MQPAIKLVVAVLVAALIAVVGVIVMTNGNDAAQSGTPAATATTVQPESSAAPEATQDPADEPVNTQDSLGSADEEAQDEAQEMYEGALAGLTEEEIAALALAEEESAARTELDGEEGALD